MENLRQIRKEKGLLQSDVSKVLGISNAAYSLYESSKRKVDHIQLKKLAEFFEVSADYLIGIIDYPISLNDVRIKVEGSKAYGKMEKHIENLISSREFLKESLSFDTMLRDSLLGRIDSEEEFLDELKTIREKHMGEPISLMVYMNLGEKGNIFLYSAKSWKELKFFMNHKFGNIPDE